MILLRGAAVLNRFLTAPLNLGSISIQNSTLYDKPTSDFTDLNARSTFLTTRDG